jgi:chemotaxis response regulator CheB
MRDRPTRLEPTSGRRSFAAVPREASRAKHLIVIGASGSDGIEQIKLLLQALPARLPAAVLVVLHRPPDMPSHLQEVLGRVTDLPVRIARDGEVFEEAACYIGEPAEHLTVGPSLTAVLVGDNLYRNRTIDLLFSTAAAQAGARSIGVVLAGSLSDGAKGLALIRRAGGAALVHDPAFTAHPDMPAAALLAVPDAETFTSPEQIAARIGELVRTPHCPAMGA